MENLKFGVWFMVVMLVQSSEADSLHSEQEPSCMSRSNYILLMRTKMIEIESEIRDAATIYNLSERPKMIKIQKEVHEAVRSLTHQLHHCQDADSSENLNQIQTCPDGSYEHGQSCYFFSKVALPWADAMKKCERDFGGYLAIITDSDENAYLKKIARSRGVSEIWIGGSDASKEGEWRRTATKERITSYHFTDWASRQPDNGSGNEHCIELNRRMGYRWNDDQCYHRQYYVCEKNL